MDQNTSVNHHAPLEEMPSTSVSRLHIQSPQLEPAYSSLPQSELSLQLGRVARLINRQRATEARAARRTGAFGRAFAQVTRFATAARNRRRHLQIQRELQILNEVMWNTMTYFVERGYLVLDDVPTAPNQADIDAIPKRLVCEGDMDDEGGAKCGICLEGVEVGEEVASLGCGHWYHEPCIVLWFAHASTCPTCRSPNPLPAELEIDHEFAQTDEPNGIVLNNSGTSEARATSNSSAVTFTFQE